MKLLLGTIFAVLAASSIACTSTVDGSTGSTDEALRRGGRDRTEVPSDEDGGSEASCPPGTELEVEHGSTSCKPHGGDGKADDVGDDDDGGVGGGAAGGSSCTTDADCGPGSECEVEVEHGVTTSFCKKHGGHD